MRSALKVIDAFGESVIWIDEIEKAFAGSREAAVKLMPELPQICSPPF